MSGLAAEILSSGVAALIVGSLAPLLIRSAGRLGLVDVPNERSSHVAPTPRVGGVAVTVAVIAGVVTLYCFGAASSTVLFLTSGAALLVGVLGYVDDMMGLGVGPRLAVHLIAATSAVYWIMGWQGLGLQGFALLITTGLTLVWALNLYNFMDGIDGIALQEAVFIALGGYLLLWGTASPWLGVLLCIATSSVAALVWNWAPARLFLGDSGSGFLGFLLAVIGLDSVVNADAELVPWLILWGIFLVDATVTLITRILTGQRWYAAHRSHAYQQLARRFGSHAYVTLGALAVNVLWLLPWAVLAEGGSVAPSSCLISSLLPLGVLAVAAGAGQPDNTAGRA
jgi:Fuc2NAc and GlcNAc transferase